MHTASRERLLAEYRHSATPGRIDVFLEYRHLRPDFIAIEMGENGIAPPWRPGNNGTGAISQEEP